MTRLKVLTVVGTRPEIIRLSRVLARLDTCCEHVLVHTGQSYDYELSQVFFDELGVRKPDYLLDSAAGSASPVRTIGNVLIATDSVLEAVCPEGMEEATVMMVGLDVDRVRRGLDLLESRPSGAECPPAPVADYCVPNVSEKVARIIHSYTDYVNRVVWRK